MITQQTAGKIWNCYREIAAAKQLLTDMDEAENETRKRGGKQKGEPETALLTDCFGDRRFLELGVPMDSGGHRLFHVSNALGRSVIAAQISAMESALAEANEQARIELGQQS